jgi:general secretion pathway protein I
MGAIIGAATQSINSVGYLRDQTFAGWVALNKINELLLDAKPWPDEGSRKGSVDLANRGWRWEAKFHKTDDPDLSRLEVTVRPYEDGPALSTLTAFKGRPPPDEPSADPSASDPSSKLSPSKPRTPKTQSPKFQSPSP